MELKLCFSIVYISFNSFTNGRVCTSRGRYLLCVFSLATLISMRKISSVKLTPKNSKSSQIHRARKIDVDRLTVFYSLQNSCNQYSIYCQIVIWDRKKYGQDVILICCWWSEKWNAKMAYSHQFRNRRHLEFY